jgi:hypothetical protein
MEKVRAFIQRAKEVFRQRWKFYLLGYAIGYAANLMHTGISSFADIFPVKLIAIGCALGLGTAFYYAHYKVEVYSYRVALRSIKYVAAITVILLLFKLLHVILLEFGIDILPYVF